MACTAICYTPLLLPLFFLASLFHISSGGRHLSELVRQQPDVLSYYHHGSFGGRYMSELARQQPDVLSYHHGALLIGNVSVNLVWYGSFKPSQKSIVADFISSLSPPPSSSRSQIRPSVSTWWRTTDKYYHLSSNRRASLALYLGDQIVDEKCSLGKSLTEAHLSQLAARGRQSYAVNVVLTAPDVAVEGFCSRCGTHGSGFGSRVPGRGNRRSRFAYIWVGNSEVQCPGQCAWPFHQPIYGPQAPALVPPNGDVGVDGMVINLAGLLAAAATNPFGNGFFQGDAEAPLEASSACPGVYAKGAYPGYPGNLLVDPVTGGSYNAHGAAGRKYLVPAIYDPTTSSCSTLV